MYRKSEKGSGPLLVILILLGVLVLGGVGWFIVKKQNDDKNKSAPSSGTISDTSKPQETSDNNTPASKLPADWAAYTIGETRIEIAYPSAWGDPKLSSEDGYSVYNYDKPLSSDGKSAYTVSFSTAINTSVSLYSNDYINGPHGGSTTYGIIGLCKAGEDYRMLRRGSEAVNGSSFRVGPPTCDTESLKGTVTVLMGGEAIFDEAEPVCSEGGCSGTTNIVVKKLSTSEFTAVILSGGDVTAEQAATFADYSHSL